MSNTAKLETNHVYIDVEKMKKKTSNYALAISVAAHIVMAGSVKYAYLLKPAAVPVEEQYIDLGYESFDEIPEARPVITKSEEIQDETSQVTGLNKKVDAPVDAPTTSTPTYADVPYYKIKPKYPNEAREAGVEGHVNMSIDIQEDGTVQNVKVTGGENLNFFESAAMRAVSKYKYKPFTDAAGNPIKKQNHLVKVDFLLKDDVASTN